MPVWMLFTTLSVLRCRSPRAWRHKWSSGGILSGDRMGGSARTGTARGSELLNVKALSDVVVVAPLMASRRTSPMLPAFEVVMDDVLLGRGLEPLLIPNTLLLLRGVNGVDSPIDRLCPCPCCCCAVSI
jgi:hypothetical protein